MADRDNPVDAQGERIAVLYKVDFARARTTLVEELAKAGHPAPDPRSRAFAEAVKRARKRIYHELRRFKAEPDELPRVAEAMRALAAETADPHGSDPGDVAERFHELRAAATAVHASTVERGDAAYTIWDGVRAAGARTAHVLDVGCGFFPLTLPLWDDGFGVSSYTALERDPAVLEVLDAYALLLPAGRLRVRGWDAATTPVPEAPARAADTVFMLQFVPLMERRAPGAIAGLAAVPAETIVVSGAIEALAKRTSVRRRERKSLLAFAAAAGRRVAAEFEAGNEIVMVLR